MALDGSSYPQMEKLLEAISAQGYQPEVKAINFEFLKGGNSMLSIKKQAV